MRYKMAPLAISIIIAGHAPSAIFLYKLPTIYFQQIFSAQGRVESLASLLGSFSFTMLGFITAILALFGVMNQSIALIKYAKRGYLDVLLTLIGMTMLELVTTFLLSIYLYFNTATCLYIRLIIALTIACLTMLLFSAVPVVMLIKQSIKNGNKLSTDPLPEPSVQPNDLLRN